MASVPADQAQAEKASNELDDELEALQEHSEYATSPAHLCVLTIRSQIAEAEARHSNIYYSLIKIITKHPAEAPPVTV